MAHAGKDQAGTDGQRRSGTPGQQFDRDVTLVVIHGNKGVIAILAEHQIGADRPMGIDTCLPKALDGRNSYLLIIPTEEAVFTRMGIDAEDANARSIDAQRVECRNGCMTCGHHQLGCQPGQ
ncbi:hypothetical protein D3C85_1135260 [compost metagenome]